MKTRLISKIAWPFLTVILVLAPLPWCGIALSESTLAKQMRMALKRGDLEQFKALLQQYGAPGAADQYAALAMVLAVKSDNLDVISLLVDKGIDINTRIDNGLTALMVAAMGGNAQMAKLLADKGADANARTDDGDSALTIASNEGKLEIAELLLENGAEVNAKKVFCRETLSVADRLP